MGKKHVHIVCAAIFALSLNTIEVFASDEEHRDLGIHEHGRGVLNLVSIDNQLAIELLLPMVNVLGFEHKPRTNKERAAADEAQVRLRETKELFVPSIAALCKVESVDVDFVGMSHEDGHDGHADEDGHDDHDGHRETAHSELHAQYLFVCSDASKLNEVEVQLFDHLLNVDEFEVQLVTENRQTSLVLEAPETTIKLK